MVNLQTFELTIPKLRIRLIQGSELQSPVVAYGRTLEELKPLLELYRERSPMVERYDATCETWTSFTSCKL
jgi:hypothetical protein